MNKRMRNGLTIATGIAVAATSVSLYLQPSQAVEKVAYTGAPTYASGDLAGIADSSTMSSTPLAQGTVRNQVGVAVSGAPMVIVAWPSLTVRNTMQIGDEITLQPVAKATTNSNGAYALRIPSASSLAPFADATSKIVDLQVIAGDLTKTPPVAFSVKVSGSGSTASVVPASAELDLTTVQDFTLNSGSNQGSGGDQMPAPGIPQAPEEDEPVPPVVVDPPPTTNPPPTPTPTPTSWPTPRPTSTPTPTPKPTPCNGVYCPPAGRVSVQQPAMTPMACTTKLMERQQAAVLLGVQYSTNVAADMDFTYKSNATSSLGWGYSLTGAGGTFSQEGKSTIESGAELGFRQRHGAATITRGTTVRYGLFKLKCQNYPGGPISTTYQTLPTSGVGPPTGERLSENLAPDSSYCAPFEPDGSYAESDSKAVTWSNGVSVPAYSASFTSQSGYTTEAKSKFHNRATGFRRLCGTGGPLNGRPLVLLFKK